MYSFIGVHAGITRPTGNGGNARFSTLEDEESASTGNGGKRRLVRGGSAAGEDEKLP